MPARPEAPIALRGMVEADRALVRNSWLRSWEESPVNVDVTRSTYYRGLNPLLDALIARGVVVACNPDDAGHVYGWICGERRQDATVVHYAQVKLELRGHGIARRLLCELWPGKPRRLVYTFHPGRRRNLGHLGVEGVTWAPWLRTTACQWARRLGAEYDPWALLEGR